MVIYWYIREKKILLVKFHEMFGLNLTPALAEHKHPYFRTDTG